MLIMTIELQPEALPDAMEPGIQCARTHWIRGFMAFQLAPARTNRDAGGAGAT